MNNYTCKNCGAELYWDAKENALFCEYCENKYQPSDFNEKSDGQKAEAADATCKANDDSSSEVDLVTYKCNNCGAEIVTAAGTVSTTCVYCGTALSLSENLQGVFRPDFVIPFNISKKEAKNIYKNYCKSYLTPKEFRKEDILKNIKGIYVPYWFHSFDDTAHAEFHCERTTSHRRGDDKVITTADYNVFMDAVGSFDKIPIDALVNLDDGMMQAVEPFDYNKMVDFNPAYMAGFYAEQFTESRQESSKKAYDRAVEAMKSTMRNNVGAYSSVHLRRYTDKVSNYDCKYAMLPVWLFNTEYQNKKYVFAVNGSTGKITGKLPICISKLALILSSVFFGSQLLIMAIRFLGG
jgi:DNA-directed RNA polymerase subunit RPC12/RpoP